MLSSEFGGTFVIMAACVEQRDHYLLRIDFLKAVVLKDAKTF